MPPFMKNKQLLPTPLENLEDYEENVHNEHGCGCLWKLWFVRRDNNSSHWILMQQEGEIKETWLKNKAKKVKEISEVLAGPKWKNFIRRFSIYGINTKRKPRFHYDPKSYALNFEEGDQQRESDAPHADFAARFAPPCRTDG